MPLNLKISKHGEERQNEVLAILIHGLSAPFTFLDEGRNWEKFMLNDERLKGVDIGIVTYDTGKLAKGIFSIGNGYTPIDELAQEMKSELDLEDYNQYNKSILVGHSMGGLVGIRYLLEEVKRNKPTRVKSFISLATPFNGSDKADFHKLIKWATPHKQIPQLEPNSKFISETIRSWITNLSNPIFSDITFTFAYGTNDRVVPKESAIPHIQTDVWDAQALEGNHTSILDISPEELPRSYKLVRDRIRKVINTQLNVTSNDKLQNQVLDLPVITVNTENEIQAQDDELRIILKKIELNVDSDINPAFNIIIESEGIVKQQFELYKDNDQYTIEAIRLLKGFSDVKNAIHDIVLLFMKDNAVSPLDENNKIALFRNILKRNLKNVVYQRIENINGTFHEVSVKPYSYENINTYYLQCTDGMGYNFKVYLSEEDYKRIPDSTGLVTDDIPKDILMKEFLPAYLFYKYVLTYTESYQWEVPDLYHFYFAKSKILS